MVKTGMRLILGLIYFVFGLNFFLKFIPMPPPPPSMAAFVGALFGTGYFMQLVKSVEVIGGAFLLLNVYTPLTLIVLAPITLNIFALHLMLEPSGLPMAIGLMVLNIGLGVLHLESYKPLFKK